MSSCEKCGMGTAEDGVCENMECPPALDLLLEQRLEIPHMVEDLGAFAGLLREAIDDADRGNIRGAAMVIEDLLELGNHLEKRVSDCTAMLARWHGWATEGGAE